MALSVKAGFGSGELDPALWERTDFEKYRAGLATCRNVVIGKSGRAVSRPGRQFYKQSKLDNTAPFNKCILYGVPYSPLVLEWGHQYVRIHETSAGTTHDFTHSLTVVDLPNVKFVTSGSYVYIFCTGHPMLKLSLVFPYTTGFLTSGQTFFNPVGPVYSASTASGAGYDVDYVVTCVVNGEESLQSAAKTGLKLPISAGTQNKLTFVTGTGSGKPTEFRFYRRPTGGGAYGFIGTTNDITGTGPWTGVFTDLGGDADYTHSPPLLNPTIDPTAFDPSVGFVYQQRLILTRSDNLEAIEASRTGFQNDFYRDFPLQDDSALTFKAGTTGNANILQFAEDSGLVVFTTVGIYINTGPLVPTNISLSKRGNWIIDKTIPPLAIPGGLLFLDSSTNTVRTLIFSFEASAYLGEEISIYSNHLFINRQIISWGFQDGDIPLVWVTFSDGLFAALTFQREQQMQAWTRHDSSSGLNVEYVTVAQGTFDYNSGVKIRNVGWFITEKNGNRYLERTADRYTDDIKEFVGMDSTVSFIAGQLRNPGSGDGLPGDVTTFTLDPVTPDDWAGNIAISGNGICFANTAGNGAVGTIFRIFDSDNSYIDLKVITFTDTQHIIVTPSAEIPFDLQDSPLIYPTFNTFSGLGHMEGEEVMIHCDGNVIASPLNDQELYDSYIVTGGSITFTGDLRGSFVHIGRPFVSDIETLDIDTVEQRPVLIESNQSTKLYIKVYNSRGIFVSNEFPDSLDGTNKLGYSVEGMEDLEYRTLSQEYTDNDTIIGNAPVPLKTKRVELTAPGEWKSQGRICLRQVDGLPFEILSIIPDSIDMRRIGD